MKIFLMVFITFNFNAKAAETKSTDQVQAKPVAKKISYVDKEGDTIINLDEQLESITSSNPKAKEEKPNANEPALPKTDPNNKTTK